MCVLNLNAHHSALVNLMGERYAQFYSGIG